MIRLNQQIFNFISADELSPAVEKAKSLLPRLAGDSMAGWLSLPDNYNKQEFAAVERAAAAIQSSSDYLVCIGIGGSYLGARAVIEALGNPGKTKILYAGNNLSAPELSKPSQLQSPLASWVA